MYTGKNGHHAWSFQNIKRMIKLLTQILVWLCALVILSCHPDNKEPGSKESVDAIYYGGDIITMEGDTATYVEAIALKDGKIVFAGSRTDAEKMKGDSTMMYDLEGRTMVPGFNDSHSHFANAINIMGQANVSSPPVGSCTKIADIIVELQKCKQENNIQDGEWIIGWGYDESQLAEKRHPTKDDFDKAFPNNPVYIQHVSGHMGVANSLALADGKIDKTTPDPDGGLILRMPGSKEPSGVLQEMAIHHYVEKITEIFTAKRSALLQKALDVYAANGVTTAQEGFTDASTADFLKKAATENKLSLDIVSLTSFMDLDKNLADTSMHFGRYQHRLKFAGTKIVADGSPQGKTAFFSKPFLTDVPGCSHDCRGFPAFCALQWRCDHGYAIDGP
jgi:predicted amidohydrolase YtcJ